MDNPTLENRRILIIDDNPNIHQDFNKILGYDHQTDGLSEAVADYFGDSKSDSQSSAQFQIDSAFQGRDGFEMVHKALNENLPYALAFIDMRMPPGWDGLKTIQNIWKIAPDLQCVICTAYSDNTWHDICDCLGHSDQLLILKKPFDDVEVSQMAISLTRKWSLSRQARMKQRDLEILVDQRTAELKHAALHDPLTGLANRTKFHDRLEEALQLSKRNDHSVAVHILDLDDFKGINDTLGHPVGDKVICGVAERLQNCLRESDTIARLGGDEFAIIQSPVDRLNDVSALTTRIFQALRQPYEFDENVVTTDVSMGITLAPSDGDQSDLLLKHADLALYRAKEDGGGCHRFFKTEMDIKMKSRRELESRLKKAIEDEHFELHYQPLFTVESDEICCLEALVRWRDPVDGLIPPNEFISIAEDTGLIVPIGQWVLKQACRDAAQWPESVRVAVNVSAIQFSTVGFVESIQLTLASTGLAPDRLEVEITESVLLQDSSETLDVLHEIRNLGARIVMDDFGTGYSSLSYLRSFPFNKLKIDRSFIKDIGEDEDATAIVRTVATLGQCLGMETTAEGVESRAQLASVAAEGYTQYQGFLKGRPAPIAEIAAKHFPSLPILPPGATIEAPPSQSLV